MIIEEGESTLREEFLHAKCKGLECQVLSYRNRLAESEADRLYIEIEKNAEIKALKDEIARLKQASL